MTIGLPKYGYRYLGDGQSRSKMLDLEKKWEIIENATGKSTSSEMSFSLAIRRCGTLNRWRAGDEVRIDGQ